MLDVLNAETGKGTDNEDTLNKRSKALPGFDETGPFIRSFAHTAEVISPVMETLKNNGLNQTTYNKCRGLTKTLPDDPEVKQRLLQWLEQHIAVKKQITRFSLLVSSDIIESLFGRFKYMLERNPQADMNRSTLLIPALCGNLDESIIKSALDSAPHDEKNGSRTAFLIPCAKSVGNSSTVPIQKPGTLLSERPRGFRQPSTDPFFFILSKWH